MSEYPPNASFHRICLTGVISCGDRITSRIKQGMTSVLRRQSSTSNENDVRMRNNRSSGHGAVNDSPPSSPAQPGDRGTRACCFCWCCCCTCSCLAVKSGNGTQGGPNSRIPLPERDDPPTHEEIESWGESFDKLMQSKGGRRTFREFLKSEYSEENILFWLACEDLKKEENPEIVEEKARLIYEDYISILSPKEVSLDSRVREVINRNMVDPTPHTFDEAQLQIYTLMHRDSYPRFLNSQMYKKLLEESQLS
ncbi:regulator of G-protein signaling 17-like isoform X1 [Mytilus galloprovincialis]|nr:regulator of G-protein signaling [Mytilus galloprovincialis]